MIMDNITRRGFLKGLLAASSLAALPIGVKLITESLVGDTYYMTEGETLEGMRNPAWAKIVVADNCVIRDCHLSNTIVDVQGDGCYISNCIFRAEGNTFVPNKYVHII